MPQKKPYVAVHDNDDMATGFGLPPIRHEGMCFSHEYPELSWHGLRNEFEAYFEEKYRWHWYNKWQRPICREIAFAAWAEALFANAKLQKKTTPEMS